MKNLILLTAIAFAAVSCSEDDGLQNSKSEANAILFGTTVQIETKAVVKGTKIPDGEKVGLYALEAESSASPAWKASANLMDNIEAVANSSGGLDYSPLLNYTVDKVYNFYAYYPHTAVSQAGGDGVVAPTTTAAPKLKVTLEKTPSAQADYMYAAPIENYKRTSDEAGVIQKLVFKHALTQIRFKFKNTEESDAIVIKSIKVKDNDKGTMSITDGEWSSLSATSSDGNTFTFFHPTTPQTVAAGTTFDIPEQLMLFPKTGEDMVGNSTLKFELALDASGTEKTVEITPTVPATGLTAGTSYLYTLLYSSTAKDFISLSTEVVDWVDAIGGDLPVVPDKPGA